MLNTWWISIKSTWSTLVSPAYLEPKPPDSWISNVWTALSSFSFYNDSPWKKWKCYFAGGDACILPFPHDTMDEDCVVPGVNEGSCPQDPDGGATSSSLKFLKHTGAKLAKVEIGATRVDAIAAERQARLNHADRSFIQNELEQGEIKHENAIFTADRLNAPERSYPDKHLEEMETQAAGMVRRKPGRGDATLSMSCSDKIARWNLLGLQGHSLLVNDILQLHYVFCHSGLVLIKVNAPSRIFGLFPSLLLPSMKSGRRNIHGPLN